MNDDLAGFEKLLNEYYTLGRLGYPEEVANIVTLLCSPLSSIINRASIAVGGDEPCY
jgi:hypothetical protein